MLAHTLEAARGSRTISRVLLSTEDEEIAAFGRASGVEVPYLRPANLATDDAPMLLVLQDLLNWLDRNSEQPVGAIVLLQPTSPLRTADHIDEAVRHFYSHPAADSVVSVVAPPHIFHPLKAWKTSGEVLVPYFDEIKPTVVTRDLPPAFARNGPAILVMRPSLIRGGDLYGKVSLPYVMAADVSVDIDEPLDLDLADMLLRKRF